MNLGDNVFLYCERGADPSLLAEPLNAASNIGFLVAALIALRLLMQRPREDRGADQFLLTALVFLVGIGSLLFHLFATRATEIADIVPIGLFMLVYLGFALNRFLLVPPGWTVLLVAGFAASIAFSMRLPILNGSAGYLPALAALGGVGILMCHRGVRAAKFVLAAAGVFALSVGFRSLDLALCQASSVAGHAIGTHFVWHLLNALTLFLLLRASIVPVGKHSGS